MKKDIKKELGLILETIGISMHQTYAENVSKHNHPYCEVVYIISGEISHEINGVHYTHKEGDCLIIPRGVVHSIYNPNRSVWRDIMIDNDLFHKVLDLIPNRNISNSEFTNIYLNREKRTELEKFAKRFVSQNDLLKKRCLGIEMLLEILCVTSATNENVSDDMPTIVKKICTDLNKNVFVRGGVAKVLNDLNYSNSYVCHTFRKHMGISLTEYIKNIRLTHIEYYLITTNYSLREIGDSIGIESLSYLNRIFKERYGITPIKFRKKHMENESNN